MHLFDMALKWFSKVYLAEYYVVFFAVSVSNNTYE